MLVTLKNFQSLEIPNLIGCYIYHDFNPEFAVFNNTQPTKRMYFHVSKEYYSYGVCDSPQQFIQKLGCTLQSLEKQLVVFFIHINKDHDNKGYGGGWRWHKWGDYIGDGIPTREYLDDEQEFEHGVYVYHVLDVTGLDCVKV